MGTNFEIDNTVIALNARKPDEMFAYEKVMPTTKISGRSYTIQKSSSQGVIPNKEDMMYTPDKTLDTKYYNRGTIASGVVETWEAKAGVDRNVRKEYENQGILSQKMTELLDIDMVNVDRYIENWLYTTSNTDADDANVNTRTTETANQWDPTKGASDIIEDLITAWKGLRSQCGRFPNIVVGNFATMTVTKVALELIKAYPEQVTDFVTDGDTAKLVTTMLNAQWVTATANYWTGSEWTDIWTNNRLYLYYSSALPGENIASVTYAQKMVLPYNGNMWDVIQKEGDDRSMQYRAFMDFDLAKVDASCVHKIAGPSGSSYQLVA